ncbi:MBL fold metallo-hydrolase [Haloterrigena alkaliphila]|uniref:MBL fold metallo-hydrolase n=1 Tax=Haloterrigena alkaliphila TaxID=2816475 RepID=UPI001CED97A1|nr:MBL fold metallo-hydrolase [Haloterrigena alkaliphila]QSW99282.2 MBL fold metallo-hydrolase [Haloterrigena alkaliphila]
MSRTNRSPPEGDQSQVHRLECSVEWPPDHTAAYLLPDEEPILVDAGMAGERARTELIDGLEAIGYEPGDVDHLLLTHAHIDHIGQVRTILEAGDPTVYAPARLRELFRRDLETVEAATRANLRETGFDSDRLEVAADELLEIHRGIREAVPFEAVDVWIDADEPVEIGSREFDSIYTPGHHVTHHCYGTELGGERVVFAGDMAIEPFRAAAIHVNFDDGVREGIDAYLEALDRLADYSFDRVYPGHGPVHDRYRETIERSRADLEDRLDRCVERLADRCAGGEESVTAIALVRDRSDDVRTRVMMLRETVAALGTLERRGRVESRLDDGVRYYEPA